MDNEDTDYNEVNEDLVHPLPEDNDPPFSPPTDPIDDASSGLDARTEQGQLDPTHQDTDNASDIDAQQLYDEGLAGAAESSEPNAGNAVVDYNPESDRRNQDTETNKS